MTFVGKDYIKGRIHGKKWGRKDQGYEISQYQRQVTVPLVGISIFIRVCVNEKEPQNVLTRLSSTKEQWQRRNGVLRGLRWVVGLVTHLVREGRS